MTPSDSTRLAIAILLLSGCNAATGADGLTLAEGSGAPASAAGGASAGTTAAGGASATSTTSIGSSGGATAGGGAGGAASTGCGADCGLAAHCDAATSQCVCDDGFALKGGACAIGAPVDPATRTEAAVCAAWKLGHVVTEPSPLSASGAQCDAGQLKPGAFVDTILRTNTFRWLAGLGPTDHDPAYDADAQLTANMEAFFDFGSGASPHKPPPSTPCYSQTAYDTAGKSNLAWGSGSPAQAIDQYMKDDGNETTLGHRRWILNPPLGPVGIGYWQTGGQYGNSQCLRVFASEGKGPHPAWYALPNPGFVPLVMAQWTWSFHGSVGGVASAEIAVVDVATGAALPVNVQPLGKGYAEDAISWTPSGWAAQSGKTYRVTVSGLAGGDVTYEVKPVDCP